MTVVAAGSSPRIAVLVKQVPVLVDELTLDEAGRLRREGLEAEINPHCRRAVTQGCALAKQWGGNCTVITLGPDSAEDCVREAIAWGADDGVLISDHAFAGSDTYATATALASALRLLGPFDLVLTGRNSVDADTGQVGPQLAELLDWPFLGSVRALEARPGETEGHLLAATCELDDGGVSAEVELPAVLSCAERLCKPAKVAPDRRAVVPPEKIRRLAAADLGSGRFGAAGSLTAVGQVQTRTSHRDPLIVHGDADTQVAEVVGELCRRGIFAAGETGAATGVADGWERGEQRVAVLCEPGRNNASRELLGEAAALASRLGGRVVAVVADTTGRQALARWGADELVRLPAGLLEQDVAAVVSAWCDEVKPWSIFVSGTMWGREVASRLAIRSRIGLTGDAIGVDIDAGRLVCWKPAFGGRLVAAVTAATETQMATMRPGVLSLRAPRPDRAIPETSLSYEARSRVHVTARSRDDDVEQLARADMVVGVGAGVPVEEYPAIEPLIDVLGAELAATRKVTDKGWLPHARQLGLTGRAISPRLYIAIGISGKLNHMIGIRQAGVVVAINIDPKAPIFDDADIGIVADWRVAVPLLTKAVLAVSAHC